MAGFRELNPDNPLFKVYLFWASILIVKVLAMAFATGRQRLTKKVFANPEDARVRSGKVKLDDPDVERVRRAHRNDLENVLPFLIMCPIYLMTGPSVYLASNLIRAFAAARIAHSILYLNEIPVIRGVAFMIGVVITCFMAGSTIMYAY